MFFLEYNVRIFLIFVFYYTTCNVCFILFYSKKTLKVRISKSCSPRCIHKPKKNNGIFTYFISFTKGFFTRILFSCFELHTTIRRPRTRGGRTHGVRVLIPAPAPVVMEEVVVVARGTGSRGGRRGGGRRGGDRRGGRCGRALLQVPNRRPGPHNIDELIFFSNVFLFFKVKIIYLLNFGYLFIYWFL